MQKPHDITPPKRALAPDVLESLESELHELRQEVLANEDELAEVIEQVHPDNQPSARNLVHYLALRRHDIRGLQSRLARVGLASLEQSEPHVLITLDRIIAMLALARGSAAPVSERPPVGFRHGEQVLAENARRLLGPARAHRNVRIMVTLPSEAGTDAHLVQEMMAAGMDCARINCAHDDATVWSAMAENVRAAERALGRECRILVDLGGPKLRTGAISGDVPYVLLYIGDRAELVSAESELLRTPGALPRIACVAPEIFPDVRPGHHIWFNEGKIGGVVEEATSEGLRFRVTNAKPKGNKLRPEHGINLPDTALTLPAFTERDRTDLAHVAAWADVIELSFVQREDDVLALQSALREHGCDKLGIVMKIETRGAFANLPQLLLTAMRAPSCGVMIARGDLAVESGFERMAEMQEEILWIAEAAHVPTVWATQVLENLAKKGTLSRAEVTDAAMSGRAEAVMLNQGPFIVDAIHTLDDILHRMQGHRSKKRSLFRALRVSGGLWDAPS